MSAPCHDLNAKVTVLSFVATVILLQNNTIFVGGSLPFPAVQSAVAAYAEFWYRGLADEPSCDASKTATVPKEVFQDAKERKPRDS